MPNYYRQRAQAVSAALLIMESIATESSTGEPESQGAGPSRFGPIRMEWEVQSQDGKIKGRIDYVDEIESVIIDYKSGIRIPDAITDNEARQLRLYAYLCSENGVDVRQGIIVRANGRRDILVLNADEITSEADRARAKLHEYNDGLASGGLDYLASPDTESCGKCTFAPICEPFWRYISPLRDIGPPYFVEGVVTEVTRERRYRGGEFVLMLRLRTTRGNAPIGNATIGPVPAWTYEADGSPPIEEGDTVRVLGVNVGGEISANPIRLTPAFGEPPMIWRA